MEDEAMAPFTRMDLLQYQSILHQRLPKLPRGYLTKSVLGASGWDSFPKISCEWKDAKHMPVSNVDAYSLEFTGIYFSRTLTDTFISQRSPHFVNGV